MPEPQPPQPVVAPRPETPRCSRCGCPLSPTEVRQKWGECVTCWLTLCDEAGRL